jgi:hypothetical protein
MQNCAFAYETIADEVEMVVQFNVEKWRYSNLTIYRTTGLTVDGNIVKIKHDDVTSEGNKTVLGLFVEGTDATDYQSLSAIKPLKLRFPKNGWCN